MRLALVECFRRARWIRAWPCLLVVPLVMGITLYMADAQQLFVYPSRGQGAQQQNKDKFECSQWATQQTGFDPTAAQSGSTAYFPPPAQAPTTSGLQGAARGAAIGAVGGAIGGNAGKGAAIGAGAGALFGGFRRREQVIEQQNQRQAYEQQRASSQAQQNATANALRANYNRAYGACLQGRGYTVN